MWSLPLTMTSLTVGSSRNCSIGPRPITSRAMSWTRRWRSCGDSADSRGVHEGADLGHHQRLQLLLVRRLEESGAEALEERVVHLGLEVAQAVDRQGLVRGLPPRAGDLAALARGLLGLVDAFAEAHRRHPFFGWLGIDRAHSSCASCCSCLATADFGSLMTTGVPRLSDSGISRLDGIEQAIFMPITSSASDGSSPTLESARLRTKLPLGRDTDVVEGVERLAQAADAGHVEARHEQQIGGALEGGQRALVEAGRRVDDHVVEVLRQQRQHLRHVRVADRVGVDGVVGAGEDEQPVRRRGEEQLDGGRVDLARAGQLRQRVLGRSATARCPRSPNCTSRSTATTRPGCRWARATARLDDTAVLPEPPFGDITTMTFGPVRVAA